VARASSLAARAEGYHLVGTGFGTKPGRISQPVAPPWPQREFRRSECRRESESADRSITHRLAPTLVQVCGADWPVSNLGASEGRAAVRMGDDVVLERLADGVEARLVRQV
jgi:hypothetical protein